MSLRLAADFHAKPRLFADLNADFRDLRVGLQQLAAQLETEGLDFAGRMLSRRRVDEVLQRFAGDHPGRTAFAKCAGEIPFEPQRNREIARIVPIATANETQHADAGFPVRAPADVGHVSR